MSLQELNEDIASKVDVIVLDKWIYTFDNKLLYSLTLHHKTVISSYYYRKRLSVSSPFLIWKMALNGTFLHVASANLKSSLLQIDLNVENALAARLLQIKGLNNYFKLIISKTSIY